MLWRPSSWIQASLALIAILTLAALPLFAQSDVHAIAAKVDQRYDRLHSLEARFTETYSGAGMTRSESGSLLLKKPGQMRWDYDQPHPKLFITDGKVAWFYVPGEHQARRTPVKTLDDLRSPCDTFSAKPSWIKNWMGCRSPQIKSRFRRVMWC